MPSKASFEIELQETDPTPTRAQSDAKLLTVSSGGRDFRPCICVAVVVILLLGGFLAAILVTYYSSTSAGSRGKLVPLKYEIVCRTR